MVGHQRTGRQRASDRRAAEQRHHAGRVGRAAPVAEREQPPTGARTAPPSRRQPRRARRRGRRGWRARNAALVLALASAERARSSSSEPASRSSPSMNGIEEVGHGSTTVIAVPACTSTRSPGCTGPTIIVLTVSMPLGVRTSRHRPGCRRPRPSRPSSEHVMQTSASSVVPPEQTRGARSTHGSAPTARGSRARGDRRGAPSGRRSARAGGRRWRASRPQPGTRATRW